MEIFEDEGLSLFAFPVLHVLSLFNHSGSASHTWCSKVLPSHVVPQPVLHFQKMCARLVHLVPTVYVVNEAHSWKTTFFAPDI